MFVTNQWKRLFFCAAPYEILQLIKKQAFLLSYIFENNWFILLVVSTSSCGCTWKSLESTQEARVARGV